MKINQEAPIYYKGQKVKFVSWESAYMYADGTILIKINEAYQRVLQDNLKNDLIDSFFSKSMLYNEFSTLLGIEIIEVQPNDYHAGIVSGWVIYEFNKMPFIISYDDFNQAIHENASLKILLRCSEIDSELLQDS